MLWVLTPWLVIIWGVVAGGQHRLSQFGMEKPDDQSRHTEGNGAEQAGGRDVARNPGIHQGVQNRGHTEQGDIGPVHDADVDGIQRNHGEDGCQQVKDLKLGVEQRGDDPGTETGSQCKDQGNKRVDAMCDGHGGNGSAQRQAAVHGEVRKIQDTKRQVDAEDHDAVDKPLFERSQESINRHGYL